MTRVQRVKTSSGTHVEDTVPSSFSIGPSSFNLAPGDTFQVSWQYLSAHGRPLTFTPTGFVINSGTGLTVSSTGLVTGVTDGGSIVLHAVDATRGLTSNTIIASCSALVRVSAAALAKLDALLEGGSASLLKINHYKPGITPRTEDVFASFAAGWLHYGGPESVGALVDDVRAPYGKKASHIVTEGWTNGPDVDAMHITALTSVGGHTYVTIAENVNTLVFDPVKNPRGAPTTVLAPPEANAGQTVHLYKVCFKNYNGDPNSHTTGVPGGGSTYESVGMNWDIVDDHTIELKWGELPGAPGKHQNDPLDSSAWTPLNVAAPGDGPPLLRIWAGSGGGNINTSPSGTENTVCARVFYMRLINEWATDYPTETQGSKLTDIDSWTAATTGYSIRGPWTGFDIFAPGNPSEGDGIMMASLGYGCYVYGTNEFNGVPGATAYGPAYFPRSTRGIPDNLETIVVYPDNRGDVVTVFGYLNGVLQQSAGSPPGTSFTFKFADTGQGILAQRWGNLMLDNTYGGGGDFPPRKIVRYYHEIFCGGGWTTSAEKPNHFDLSLDTAGPYHPGQLVTVRCTLMSGHTPPRPIDQMPGWRNRVTLLDPHFVADGPHGEVMEVSQTMVPGSFPTFTIQMRLHASYLGGTSINVKLRRFRDGAFDGVETTGTIPLTVVA